MGDIIDLFVAIKQLEAKVGYIYEAMVKKGILKEDKQKPKQEIVEDESEETPEEELDMPQEDDEPEDAEITLNKQKFEQKRKKKW